MQQGLLQRIEGDELALVERFEANRFRRYPVKLINQLLLIMKGWQMYRELPQITESDKLLCRSISLTFHSRQRDIRTKKVT